MSQVCIASSRRGEWVRVPYNFAAPLQLQSPRTPPQPPAGTGRDQDAPPHTQGHTTPPHRAAPRASSPPTGRPPRSGRPTRSCRRCFLRPPSPDSPTREPDRSPIPQPTQLTQRVAAPPTPQRSTPSRPAHRPLTRQYRSPIPCGPHVGRAAPSLPRPWSSHHQDERGSPSHTDPPASQHHRTVPATAQPRFR